MFIFWQQALLFVAVFCCRRITNNLGSTLGIVRHFRMVKSEHVVFHLLTICNLAVSFYLLLMARRPVFSCGAVCKFFAQRTGQPVFMPVRLIEEPTLLLCASLALFIYVVYSYTAVVRSSARGRFLSADEIAKLYGGSQHGMDALYRSSCDQCSVASKLHVRHSAYGCCQFFDHTCCWCASDISAANMARFLRYLKAHLAFAVSAAIWPAVALCYLFRWHYKALVAALSGAIGQKLFARNMEKMLAGARPQLFVTTFVGSREAFYLTYLLLLQLFSAFATFSQLCKQFATSRRKYCVTSGKIVDQCVKMVKRGEISLATSQDGKILLESARMVSALKNNVKPALSQGIRQLSAEEALGILEGERSRSFRRENAALWRLLDKDKARR